MTLLTVTGLHKSFGGVVAARDVSFTVARGEMLAIIGPNGAGKSTVFNMVGGQLGPDRGQVLIDGQDITHASPQARFRGGVGRTFQVAQTFLSMSAAENVQMALISRFRQSRGLWTPARERHRAGAVDLLAQVGMAEAADMPCSALAYGDVKRVELAIALAGQPKLLLMDEPTAGMAPQERAALMDLTASIAASQGIGVLFTEHDMDVVFGHAARVIVLLRGQIIAAGTPDEIRQDPQVRRAYLGDSHALEPSQGTGPA
ncbi:branched-chain amino acid transport system ATP-binding protein [Microvirga flocculans]|uniref:Branched-chain amino acid transport system ATP-binding protein n=1 Tax=Microvirga flocculans TaxID=217168 RepID=A0A7W6IBT8_9HYPH|nr:ABC transporter ATP-binding protein [Microvirga flocculans]MBB4038554.1 branched-chain amino acid transport system ATP-binding protein [Microvirga flocculans]